MTKFTNALVHDLEAAGVRGQPLGVDFVDINLIGAFEKRGITLDRRHDADDGGPRDQEPRRDQGLLRSSARSATRSTIEFTNFLKPGLTENEVAAFGFELPLLHPGHGGRRGRHRLVRTQRVAELAQLLRSDHPARRSRDHRPGGAHVERLQVVLLSDLLRRRQADARPRRRPTTRRISGCGTRSRQFVRVRPPRTIAAKWPSARGGVGLCRGRSGRRQQLGTRPRARAVRPAGHLPDLVARPSRRDPGRE